MANAVASRRVSSMMVWLVAALPNPMSSPNASPLGRWMGAVRRLAAWVPMSGVTCWWLRIVPLGSTTAIAWLMPPVVRASTQVGKPEVAERCARTPSDAREKFVS